jgi:uncharacterized membrane protein YfhO
VDGSESQVVRVDHAFRGVVVPPGNHRIEFRYEPQSFAWGVRLMLLAAVAAGSWAFLLLRRAL